MNWHRLFGLILTDFFTDSPYVVELEKDLALQKQLLDVVVLRRSPGRFVGQLPDGLDNLSVHNLITFKSYHEALDDWALKELTGHYVNYRKQVSPADGPLLPEQDFRLYAVCSRHPHNLANDLPLEQLQAGVYQCRRGTDVIRIVVAGQVPKTEHNALLHLFSASSTVIGYGAGHYEQRSQNTSTLLEQLVAGYEKEGLAMSYTMADFQRDYAKEHFKDLTPEEQLEVLHDLSPEKWREALRRLPPEQRLAGLSPEERLAGLSAAEIARLLKKSKSGGPASKGKSRGKN